ncbi:hypothetical protein PPACK8108_LOCUS3171 [Phakopsora pachyrhizi]|uniref:Uncharacterized protein n=1 Tax=Phakopsora pachyrhizi TaxID=170000 RepID=A0AAV0AKL9_PHAPC|nr:hypothetical protein PPACK8108_LOCUS3171 [Phakopsora pachyrhizi]
MNLASLILCFNKNLAMNSTMNNKLSANYLPLFKIKHHYFSANETIFDHHKYHIFSVGCSMNLEDQRPKRKLLAAPEKLTVIKIKVILKKFNIQFNSKHLQAMLVELYIDLASQQCPEIASSWKSKSMPVSTQSPSPYARSNLNVCRELLQGWLRKFNKSINYFPSSSTLLMPHLYSASKRFNICELKSILDFYEVPYPNPPGRPDVVNLYEALKSKENPELNPPSDRKTQSTCHRGPPGTILGYGPERSEQTYQVTHRQRSQDEEAKN